MSDLLSFSVTLLEWFLLQRSPGEHKGRGENIMVMFLAQNKSSKGLLEPAGMCRDSCEI